MGGLRDQLLKSGLVNEKQVKKAQQEKRKASQQQQGKSGTEADQNKRELQRIQAEKAERDRQLNLERAREAERKAITAQVRQLIEAHRQPKGGGEVPFNFVDGEKVKRLYLADSVRGQIARGQLAIVKLDQQYELVPAEVAEKIRQRDAGAVILQNDPARKNAPREEDDPYAAYQVPDDLLW